MKILLIEDEKKIRDYLKKHLQPLYFELDTADDGEKGLRLLKSNHYDLLILDNILPKKTGKEVCSEARAFGIHTPILMLSVLSTPQEKVELLNAGADDYLAKPFSFKELHARIQALLRRPKEIEQDILRVADLELNVLNHEVIRSGIIIELTRKEFMLLHYLMKNKGMVLSRVMIIEQVWEMNADPFSNTIEAHIASLRKKLNDKDQFLIKTISGRGYKMISL